MITVFGSLKFVIMIKRIVRELICLGLYVFYRLTHRLPQVSSIYFHDPSPELFETVLKWYEKHHYRFVSLKELTSFLVNKQQPKERVAYISFDDGWRSNLDLLPICEKYNAPITVFVATEPLVSGNFWWEYVTRKYGRPTMLTFKKKPEKEFYEDLAKVKEGVEMERSAMTINELVQFSQNPLVTIQSHTINHPIMTNLSDETLKMELTESKHVLESLLGYPIDVFSYPNGDVGPREIEALKEAGYRYAFTTKAKTFDIKNCNPYLLPRMAMNTNGGKYDNLAKLTGIWYRFSGIKKQ